MAKKSKNILYLPGTTSHSVPATMPMGKERARNSCDVHISADCTLFEMRIVASCQNALSFHGQRNRWDPPLPPPSPSQGPQRSPHGKSSRKNEFFTGEREREREEMNFLPRGFNQVACCSGISDLRSIQRFPEIQRLEISAVLFALKALPPQACISGG